MKTSFIITAVALALPCNSMANQLDVTAVLPQLANEYQQGVVKDWAQYLYSEKLDGIRAIWNGESLYTRTGNKIAAPVWFTERLPDMSVEGELWAGRGKFEQVMSAVMDDVPDDNAWRSIRFMLFDLPNTPTPFEARYEQIKRLVDSMDLEHVSYVLHLPALNEQHINHALISTTKENGEGLMLRHRQHYYVEGRSDGTLKMKLAQDAEAEVIGYVDGKGKHEGRLGALIVKMKNGLTFKIGTGFSDGQRENPPPLGTQVTYRYNGFTKNGIPKFARFVRVDTTKQ